LTDKSNPGFAEFVVLTALIISMVALSIDSMLPALPAIAADLGVARFNDTQLVISIFFAGMALGQMIFGPMSDALGRRPAIFSGFAIFGIGCVMSILAEDYTTMLIGRFLQGLGASGPRTVTVALVRDCYKGREMARVMSFVMSIFILVPVFAPAIGQLIILVASWRYIFAMFLGLSALVCIWMFLRLHETLPLEHRIPFSIKQMLHDSLAILRIRAAIGYTITMGFIFGAFITYLSNSQQIFQVQYALGNLFVVYFGVLACSIGAASLANAKLVTQYGMRFLSRVAMIAICLLSGLFYGFSVVYHGHPPLGWLMAYLLITFFFFGLLFGNLNALAMEPLGYIAGLGSAIVGTVSTLMSALLGYLVADRYDGTILPMLMGFTVFGFLGLLVMRWTESGATAEAPG
jgi:MFS transporter, DHA1 family, multidrug resistance protein